MCDVLDRQQLSFTQRKSSPGPLIGMLCHRPAGHTQDDLRIYKQTGRERKKILFLWLELMKRWFKENSFFLSSVFNHSWTLTQSSRMWHCLNQVRNIRWTMMNLRAVRMARWRPGTLEANFRGMQRGRGHKKKPDNTYLVSLFSSKGPTRN